MRVPKPKSIIKLMPIHIKMLYAASSIAMPMPPTKPKTMSVVALSVKKKPMERVSGT